MGCVSSKLARADRKEDLLFAARGGDTPNHIVSLTSTTYGVLNLDREQPVAEPKRSPPHSAAFSQKRVLEGPEIINAWELMHDLDEEIPVTLPVKKSPRHESPRSGSKSKQGKSPRPKKRVAGKENAEKKDGVEDGWGRAVLMPFKSLENLQISDSPLNNPKPKSVTPVGAKLCNGNYPSFRRSFGPLFDPDLVASFEKELSEEKEQIKEVISPLPRSRKPQSLDFVDSFEMKCPPGGENSVVIYTTTLRGIRKTFEDCNRVRSAVEAYDVRMIERDISMHSGFREELKALMGGSVARVPAVFVKGRFVGGAEEVMKLEEEGKLSLMFQGIPRALERCEGCGGLRFVMCMDCNGSCKVLDDEGRKMVKCGHCNENGLIQCPICSW